MILKNNRAPLLSNIKLYASFHHHMWIQTGVTVRKRLSWVVTSVTLTFDLWPWPFAWTLHWSLVIKFHDDGNIVKKVWRTDGQTDGQTDRQTENTICRAAWSQLKIIGHLFYITSRFVHHLKPPGEFKLELLSGNAQFGSKSVIFFTRVTLIFDGWPWKTIGRFFYATLSFVHHFKAIVEFKLELQSGNTQFRSKSAIFCPLWPWNLMHDLEKQWGTSSMLLQAFCIIL